MKKNPLVVFMKSWFGPGKGGPDVKHTHVANAPFGSGNRDDVTKRHFNGLIAVVDPDDYMTKSGLDRVGVARLSGAMDGAEVTIVDTTISGNATFRVRHEMLDDEKPMERSVRRTAQGFIIINHGLMFRPEYQRLGIGSRSFAMEVMAAVDLGASSIQTVADGSPSDAKFVGWRVWPKLGYDASLNDGELKNLPASLSHARTVLDLHESKEGELWWLKNGYGRIMTFMTDKDSRSFRVLSAYLNSRGIVI